MPKHFIHFTNTVTKLNVEGECVIAALYMFISIVIFSLSSTAAGLQRLSETAVWYDNSGCLGSVDK